MCSLRESIFLEDLFYTIDPCSAGVRDGGDGAAAVARTPRADAASTRAPGELFSRVVIFHGINVYA